ncbi:MAG TPA: transglutaminase-like domain-containing protein [Thermoleophilia bacterium]|nr:transglutaminase-like domain-containing protein [Thermoleophilia bacterium]
MVLRKLLYLVCFVGLALTTALAVDRVGSPSVMSLLLPVIIVAVVAGGPGLIHRRLWPVGLALVPLGAWLVLRWQVSLPPTVHGFREQLGFLRQHLAAGGVAYVTQHLPFDFGAAPELGLLVSFVVYLIVALAAFAALSLRKALPAVVLLLALLGFGLTIDDAGRVVWLPLAFLLLAGCLLMLARSLEREQWKPVDSLAGVATTLVAAFLGLFLLGATSAAASQPWQDWRTWGGPISTHVSTNAAFNWLEDYPSLLDPENDVKVMRVRSPIASYWRANALDYFTGTNWFGDGSSRIGLTAQLDSGFFRYSIPDVSPAPPGRLVTQEFEIRSLFTDYFFAGGVARTLIVGRDLPVTINNAQGLGVEGFMGPKLDYVVTAVVPQVKPAGLVGRGRDYPGDVLPDIALPFPTLPEAGAGATGDEAKWRDAMSQRRGDPAWLGLYRLNGAIVGQASDPYEVALRVEKYLRQHYTYSLDTKSTPLVSPYAEFLFKTRVGFCQHFAGAMAALMRFNGVPARVALGFATGDRDRDGRFVVSRTDAHAWVEVYFPQVGWVPFDPTPGRSIPGLGPSSTSAGFLSPFAGDSADGDGGSSAAPARNARALRDPGSPGGAGSNGVSAGPSVARVVLRWGIVLLAVLLAWPAGRALWRRRAVSRGGPDGRLRVSLRLLYADLRDYGVVVPRSQTLEETSRFLHGDLGLDAAALAGRVQAVLFGGRRATRADVAEVAELRRDMQRTLRTRQGLMRRLLALYGLSAISTGRG